MQLAVVTEFLVVPRRGAVLVEAGGDRAALFGQLVLLATLDVGRGDQPAVLELAERGVDGAGTRLPPSAAARLELGDQLVAVHRALVEQGQDGIGECAAPGAAAAVAMGPAAVLMEFVQELVSSTHVVVLSIGDLVRHAE